MEITRYGFIKGGLCEKRLLARKERSEGAKQAWEDMKDMEYVIKYKGWYQIKKIQTKRLIGTNVSVNFEIGYLRMLQIVFPSLLKLKKKI